MAAMVRETYSFIKIMQFVSPNYNGENGVKKIRLTEENFSQKLYLVSIAKKKDPNIRVKMHQTFFLFLPLFVLYLLSGCDLFNISCLS